jgi:DNA-binding HxlR family transcriptional regulator
MKRTDRKSACPINFGLEIFGDPWSLLILRDIALFGKNTFKEFLASEERITTSVLTDRLVRLEKRGIVRREPHPTDRRSSAYVLTEKGLALIPVLLDLMEWGTTHDPASAGHRKEEFLNKLREERGPLIHEMKERVRRGGAILVESSSTPP